MIQKGGLDLEKTKLGFALTGSFCTFELNLKLMKELAHNNYDIIPIMSFNAASIDTRFGKAKDFRERIEDICGKKIICTIEDAEPIGPKNMTDIMLVSPCTGNTLSKLAYSITDTPVTMAVKSHLRNNRPVVIGVSTNDALAGSAKNIGILSNLRNYYFVPLRQDNSKGKPNSLVARFDMTMQALECAMNNIQLEPVVLPPL